MTQPIYPEWDWRNPDLARTWSEKVANGEGGNPVRPEHLDMLLHLLEDVFEPGKTLLDLGSGSGIVEQMIFERLPHAQIVGVDRSEAMMALAAERLQDYPFRFVQVIHDLGDLPSLIGIESKLPRQHYQIVFSVQALHHLSREAMTTAYLTIYDILEPGGYFFLIDRMQVESAALFPLYRSLWKRLSRLNHRAVEEGETYLEHVAAVAEQGDQPAPLLWHLEQLKAAGFEADCLHAHGNRAFIAGVKPQG